MADDFVDVDARGAVLVGACLLHVHIDGKVSERGLLVQIVRVQLMHRELFVDDIFGLAATHQRLLYLHSIAAQRLVEFTVAEALVFLFGKHKGCVEAEASKQPIVLPIVR